MKTHTVGESVLQSGRKEENIHALYDIFANIENSYNLLVETIEGNQAVKYFSVNQINKVQDMINDITSEVKT